MARAARYALCSYFKDARAAFVAFDISKEGALEDCKPWKADLDAKVRLPSGEARDAKPMLSIFRLALKYAARLCPSFFAPTNHLFKIRMIPPPPKLDS
jgi:hypothetical protein